MSYCLTWPQTRDEYIKWLAGRIEGYGNELIEPIKSLVEDGYVELIDKPYSSPTRLTEAGKAYHATLVPAQG